MVHSKKRKSVPENRKRTRLLHFLVLVSLFFFSPGKSHIIAAKRFRNATVDNWSSHFLSQASSIDLFTIVSMVHVYLYILFNERQMIFESIKNALQHFAKITAASSLLKWYNKAFWWLREFLLLLHSGLKKKQTFLNIKPLSISIIFHVIRVTLN